MAISLQSQQPLSYAEVIDGLRNSEQRRYDYHSASAAFEERRGSLIFKCLPTSRKITIISLKSILRFDKIIK